MADNVGTTISTPDFFEVNPRGKTLTGQSKQILMNVYAKLRATHPTMLKEDVIGMVSDLTGISARSVFKVKAEKRKQRILKSPAKKRARRSLEYGETNKQQLTPRYDDMIRMAVRRKIHAFFFANQPPTLNLILGEINNDPDLPPLSRATLHRLMQDLGFTYVRRQKGSVFTERPDLIAWRHRFLRSIRHYRQSGRNIVYLDETWVNFGHTTPRIWFDKTINCARDATLKGLSTGLKSPSGKGGRLIVVHAGGINGFVEAAELVFESKKKEGDYHAEMDGHNFEKWFSEKLLPNIPENSVIVLDNASYHSVKVEKLPSATTKKPDIAVWLLQKGLLPTDYNPKEMLKAELLEIVHRQKHQFEAYRVDVMATQAGHTILRLPPYHCELNPIELVWSQVKGYVAANNKTFKRDEVKTLLAEGINSITPEMWNTCVNHTIKIEHNFWNVDNLSENEVNRLVIEVGSDSESDS